ncbi:MAG: hypothetical protein QNL88_02325 [Acidobacteriota bacterium]|nr:hypothetical protein [Acidobacteriota bacterium]
MRKSRTRMLVASVMCWSLLIVGCGSSGSGQPAPTSTGKPSVTQVGRTQVRTIGADLEGIVSYKYADSSLGDEWMIIDVALTGERNESIEVKLSDVSVLTPDGRRIPLPTQQEFIDAYPQLQSTLRRAAVASQPLEATRGGKRACDLNFLRIPGTGSTRDAIWINQRELCVGMLAFPVDGGIQPGRWKLIIELEESSLEIPFDLGR